MKYFKLDAMYDEENCNKILDDLKSYDTLKELHIHGDSILAIPSNVLKFKNLKYLEVSGCRFWKLNMTQVPISVETLILTRHANLQPKCIVGMERLVNLKNLEIMDVFGITACVDVEQTACDSPCDDLRLPNMKGLTITFESQTRGFTPIHGWREQVLNDALFKNIKNDDNITLEADTGSALVVKFT